MKIKTKLNPFQFQHWDHSVVYQCLCIMPIIMKNQSLIVRYSSVMPLQPTPQVIKLVFTQCHLRVVRWLALSPHSSKVKGLNLNTGLSCTCVGFFQAVPQSKKHACVVNCQSKLTIDVSASVNGCLTLC